MTQITIFNEVENLHLCINFQIFMTPANTQISSVYTTNKELIKLFICELSKNKNLELKTNYLINRELKILIKENLLPLLKHTNCRINSNLNFW